MPTATDSVLGICYVEPDYVVNNAAALGCEQAIAPLDTSQLTALIALASREVDNHCGRTFTPDPISENHRFDPATRRISVNNPPVIELISFNIRIAPQVVSTFDVANVLINNQENYLELASLAAIASQQLTSQVIALGITEPQVEITYRSYQSVPQAVAAATALVAAFRANESFASAAIAPGIASLKSREQQITRDGSVGSLAGIPKAARDLLRGVSQIAVG
jgi:hypothetical protein